MTNRAEERGLEVRGVSVELAGTRVLAGINLSVQTGEIIGIIGPSGSGKTTLLRSIAGLTRHSGSVCWRGDEISKVPPERRGFGLMFQDHALFPHLDVVANVSFGLISAGLKRASAHQEADRWLELVGLDGFTRRRIESLSGGERQRVALARALAPQPGILMLDEPLGALDRRLRERLSREVGQLLRAVRQTALYVTHDQQEAFSICDRIVVLIDGRIHRMDHPEALFDSPGSVEVARFLGHDNIFPCSIEDEEVVSALGRFPIRGLDSPQGDGLSPGSSVAAVMVRPDAIRLGEGGRLGWTARVERREFQGALVALRLVTTEFALEAVVPRQIAPAAGDTVHIGLDPKKACVLLAPESPGNVASG